MVAISIIGGAGFVGRRLASDLQHTGYSVRVADTATAVWGGRGTDWRVDVNDRVGLLGALEGCDIVYNLAAVHRDDVRPLSLYDEVNIAGAVNVCGVCRELGIGKIIFTSSVAVYGVAAPSTSEEGEPAPVNAYGRSKLRAEQVYREWQAEEPERRSLVIVRPTVVFGEGNRGNVYQLLCQIMARRFVMVGSGHNRKSMAYVGNLSAFLVHALGLGAGTHLFNYADGPDLSMEELVQTILRTLGRPPVIRTRIPCVVGYLGGLACDTVAAITGRRFPISAVRIKKFCSTTTFSADRVRATGFRAPISLPDALVKTIRHEIRVSADSDAVTAD